MPKSKGKTQERVHRNGNEFSRKWTRSERLLDFARFVAAARRIVLVEMGEFRYS